MKPEPQRLHATGLTELEKTGVLMSRMQHELTNCLSVLAGNVQLMQTALADPDRLKASLRSLQWAGDAISEIVGRYAEYRHQIARPEGSCALAELIDELKVRRGKTADEGGPDLSGWQVVTPETGTARLRCEPRWIGFAVWEAARISRAAQGQIVVYSPGAHFDPRGLKAVGPDPFKNGDVHIMVRWQSEKPAMAEKDLFKPATLDMAVMVGIIRWVSGHASYGFISPVENRFWITLPTEPLP
jgi:hypothetical protein